MEDLFAKYPKFQRYHSDTGPSGYSDLIESIGVEILVDESVGSYQGETFCLLRHKENGKLGLLNYGWGSCSGCDSFEAATSVSDLVAIRDGFAESIEWFDSPNAALARVSDPKWLDDFYDKPHEFVTKVAAWVARAAVSP